MQQDVAFIEQNFARSITYPGQHHKEALSVVIMKTSFVAGDKTATHLKGDGGANW